MSTQQTRRMLTIGHSYAWASNRRLPHEIAKASGGRWEVAVAGPSFYRGNPRYGDLNSQRLTPAQNETIDVHGVPMFFTNRIHVALYGRALRRLMQQRWDVIHCWEEPYILSGAQLALWTPRSSVLTYMSFQNINKRYPPPFNATERYAMHRADGWLAASHTVEAALLQRPFYRSRPHSLAGVGVDVEAFAPNRVAGAQTRSMLGWSESDVPVIGYLGRFTESKGIPLLMRTLDRLTDPWRALIVGAGELEATLRAWAQRYGDRVRVCSDVTQHERVPGFLNAMDLLVGPSQTTPIWREQFGRMLIEAFACGIPVIGSDSGEIPNVIGDAGLVVGERDEEAWLAAIGELVRNPARREDLRQRGLERVRGMYAWSVVGQKYLEFFEMLLEQKQRSARAA
jgi:glycosyltransferase involved in cell wall biosynthesis